LNLILGIDPGVSGALALFDPGVRKVNPFSEEQRMTDTKVIEIIDMPTFEIQQGKFKRRQIDTYALANWLLPRRPRIAKATVEEVSAMPKDAATTAFTFGTAYGVIQGLLAGMLLPAEFVRPKAWKKMFQLGSDKDESRRAASRLFPEASHYWQLKKHDGRAEALLIGVFGARALMPTARAAA
jgi:crossover junction endodeoxyribonuclease RuvC